MNEPTLRDIMTSLEGVHTRLGGVESRLDGHDGRFDGIEHRLDRHDKRFDGIETRLAQHGVALHDLSEDVRSVRSTLAVHSALLGAHSATLDRIECRQTAETGILDDHERRITALERRQ
jgi:hypothetical protein